MSKRIIITKVEANAIAMAQDYVQDLLEKCNADPLTYKGKIVLSSLKATISGLSSLKRKYVKANQQ